MILTPKQLRDEIFMIEQFLRELPARLTESEQLMLTTNTLGRTLGSLRDVMDTLAAHLESVPNGENQ